MLDWLDEVAGPGYSQVVLWTLLALLLLIVLLIVLKVIRSMTFGTFVAGGRNRKTRLAVMDATAVDSHRRLVLVRRDDVEHLLLIGGPTDVVVESDIRIGHHRRMPAPGEPPREQHAPPTAVQQPAPLPAPVPQPVQVPAPAPVAQRKREPEPPPSLPQPLAFRPAADAPVRPAPRPPEPAAAARPLPRPEVQRPAPLPASPPVLRPGLRPDPAMPAASTLRGPARTPPSDDLLDDALLKELEVSLDDGEAVPRKAPTPSLDDEMAKLLGELSKPRR